jgi:hypothetical protein
MGFVYLELAMNQPSTEIGLEPGEVATLGCSSPSRLLVELSAWLAPDELQTIRLGRHEPRRPWSGERGSRAADVMPESMGYHGTSGARTRRCVCGPFC